MKVLIKYILVTDIVAKDTTAASGLFNTSMSAENMRYQEALVVMPGSDVDSVNVGETVVYDRAQGHHVTIDGVTYRVILERDVAVVL